MAMGVTASIAASLLLAAAMASSGPGPGTPPRPLPPLLALGQRLEEARPGLASGCERLEERNYTGAMAAPFHQQTQIDCHGLPVLGSPRKVELMFNEGVLGFLWILVEPAELEALDRRLTELYGTAVYRSGRDRVYGSGTVALRNSPAEILVATPKLIRELTGYEPPSSD